MEKFPAFRVHDEHGKITARFEDITLQDLGPGDVVIEAAYSDVNYKDALAATGTGKIMKRFPMVAGTDVAGEVHSSRDARFKPGDRVLVVGCGLGEVHDGGYARYARVAGDWVVKLPVGMSLRGAMALGTAGFTAGMAVQRMEENGQRAQHGPILVNGATGGVGSLATAMFAQLGYEVVAYTGKRDSAAYLESIGARSILLRESVELGGRPLEKALWGGAVDNVGGDVLSWLTRTVKPFGNIAAIGLAGGYKLDTTVMPFILRGISLLGINSTYCPVELRNRVWERLADDLWPNCIDKIVTREIAMAQLPGVFDEYVKGRVVGRTVVKI